MAKEVDWGTEFTLSWTDEMNEQVAGLVRLDREQRGEPPEHSYGWTGREVTKEVERIREICEGRLEAAPEAFAIPLVPLLERTAEPLAFEIESLTQERDAYLLRYFLWGQLFKGQSFRRVDLRLRLPTKGAFTIYSMWPETEQVVIAGASLDLDVGVDPALRIGVPQITLAPGVSLGGGFHADAKGRFLLFKEWKRLKATVQAKGIAGRAAEWLLDKPKRFIGNVEFLLVVFTPKDLQRLTIRVDGTYWLKTRLWRAPVPVGFKQRAKTQIGSTSPA
ncbi:MAG: hypothetical protein ACRDJB_10480 [Actinomycetota bacterium]